MIKYGESVTRYVKLYQYETLDPATSSEWTPASGDVKVSKDGGTGANITTLPTYDSSMRLWKVSLSATEAEAKIVTIDFQDVTGDAINPVSLDIETFGNASAQYPSTFPVPVVSGDLPTNFADLAITSSTGLVSVGTLATDCVNASALASDAVAEIQSGLATSANQVTIEGKIDTIDGIVDTILVDTDAVQTAIAAGLTVDLNADQSGVTIGTVNSVLIPGTVATVANQTTIISALAVIDSLVDAILVDTGTTLPDQLNSLTVDLNADQSGVTIGGIAGTINTFDELDTALDAAHGAGSWLSGSGGGGSVVTIIGAAGNIYHQMSIGLITFEDAVDHLIDAFNLTSQTLHQRRAMRAVMEAYDEIDNHNDWSYLTRQGRITTAASQTTGTIAYDHTGGAYERLLTLSDATFPTDVSGYYIIIDNHEYRIHKLLSTTTAQLSEDLNPGEDIASGTAYELYKGVYPLPVNFKRGAKLVDRDSFTSNMGAELWISWMGNFSPQRVSPQEMLEWKRNNYRPSSVPLKYCIRGETGVYGGLYVEFAPPPSEETVFDFYYEAHPRPIKPIESGTAYSTGTVTGVTDNTVTGSGTSWTNRMVGSVIRFSSNSTTPTGLIGSSAGYQPYQEQRVITAVNSATELEIDATLIDTPGTGYTISDPIDVQPEIMTTPFLMLAEAIFCRHSEKPGLYAAKMEQFYGKLRESIAMDNN